MPRKKKSNKKAKVHTQLKGLEIGINEFGEIVTNYDINKINAFLNQHVQDKKLEERDKTIKKQHAKRKKRK